MEGKRAVAAVGMNRVRDERYLTGPGGRVSTAAAIHLMLGNVGSPTLLRGCSTRNIRLGGNMERLPAFGASVVGNNGRNGVGRNHYSGIRSLLEYVPRGRPEDKIVANRRHVFYRL